MRSVVVALLGLILGLILAPLGAGPARAQAWLTVADADGRFRLEIPVPFDLPPPQVAPDGSITIAYVHEAPDLALRFEVVDSLADGLADHAELAPAPALASRIEDGERMVQVRSRVVGRRTYRLVAVFPPALEGDAVILRFMQSVRYND